MYWGLHSPAATEYEAPGGFAVSWIFNQHVGFKVMLALVASPLCQNRLAEPHGLPKQRTSSSQLYLPLNLNPKSSVNTKMFIKKQNIVWNVHNVL